MIAIKPLKSSSDMLDSTLRSRADRANDDEIKFIITINNKEVGILCMQDWTPIGFITEIFVLPQYRNMGFGSRLLQYVEKTSNERHHTTIRLTPDPFDRSIGVERLKAWYSRHGYKSTEEDPQNMEKRLFRYRLTKTKSRQQRINSQY